MSDDIEDIIKNNNSNNDSKNYNNVDYSKFDKEEFKKIYDNLIFWLKCNNKLITNSNNKILTNKFNQEFNKQLRSIKAKNYSKSIVINVFKINNFFEGDDDKHFKNLMKMLLRKKPTRNESGITSVTVITSPFPFDPIKGKKQKFSCKHDCFFCPNEPAHEGNNWQAQPRSYLFNEPAVLRANQHEFDAIRQMYNRLLTLLLNGLIVDKIEIVVEGGTATEYPEKYLETYIRDLFYSANTFSEYFKLYSENIEDKIIRKPLSIEEEKLINKTSDVHIVGISLETRPDAIDDDWIINFRNWGITKIQLGVQHTDNKILKKINRGHDIECAIKCIERLKDEGFKVHIHIMPDLPDCTPEKDKYMFDFVYDYLQPDEMKIYPCQVVPWTKIAKWNKEGLYTPYSDNDLNLLIDVIKYAMINCPSYIRFPRVLRDIPATYVKAGTNVSNLRQLIDLELEKENLYSNDIRTREIGRNKEYYDKPAKIDIEEIKLKKSEILEGKKEYFISYVSLDSKKIIHGFIRLRIVPNNKPIFKTNINKGLVRELHVYGDTIQVGLLALNSSQHRGIGKKLLKKAEELSYQNNMKGISVISGEGVKGYYEKFGYYEEDTYMVKKFNFYFIIDYYVKLIINFIKLILGFNIN